LCGFSGSQLCRPNDDFSLPVMELMIDFTTKHEALSFVDYTTGYNQI